MQQSKSGGGNDEDTFIRILIDSTESERLQVDLKPGEKLVPQELKFAFVDNDATDWAVYANTLLLRQEKVSAKSTQADNSSNNTQKESKR